VFVPDGRRARSMLRDDTDAIAAHPAWFDVCSSMSVVLSIAPRRSYTAHSTASTGIASMSAQDLSELDGLQGRE
jgi:hypothetical protein